MMGMLLDFVVRNFTDLGIPYTHGNFDQGFVHSDGGWGMSGTSLSIEVGGVVGSNSNNGGQIRLRSDGRGERRGSVQRNEDCK
jgi:hypothetical protein